MKKRDIKWWIFIGYTIVFWLSAIVGAGYLQYINFWKNTPERWSEPANWYIGIGICLGYIIQRLIGRMV